METLRLAPRLDLAALKTRLSETGRVHIPAIFPEAVAEAIHSTLVNDSDWALAVNQLFDMDQTQLAALTLPQLKNAAKIVAENARNAFYYVYDTCRIKDALEGQKPVAEAHHQLFQYVNSPPFIEFLRELTGDDRVSYLDMQATRYRPGHFLTTHSDLKANTNRLYAYVFNFTPNWRTDYGGLLLFLDEKGHVLEGFTPTFNALNILKVPAPHCVTMVTPAANGARYSYTGWMHSGPRPTAPE